MTWRECLAASWNPAFGDLDRAGIILTGGYIAAVLAVTAVALHAPFPPATRQRERVFWTLAALGLLILAVNKQLDLQVYATDALRCIAQADGWFDRRRMVQAVITVLAVAAALVLAFVLLRLLSGTYRRSAVLLCGLAFLTFLILLRIIAANHMQETFRTGWLTFWLYRRMEAAALAVIILWSAFLWLRPQHLR